jgi:alkylation response protein AidB-like acyl-CoA dehydrogenase
MRFAFSDEQHQFQRSVREVLARECTSASVRQAWTTEPGRSPERWKALVDLGVVGALIPESEGGLGMSALDLVLAIEECGRAALPEPIVETATLAAPLLASVDAPRARACLAEISSGTFESGIVGVGLESEPFVADADVAHRLILERAGDLHLVPRTMIRIDRQRSVDGARRLFRVEWTPRAETKLTGGEAARDLVADLRDRAAVMTGAFLLGLARRMVESTVEYAKVRTQFGQPIGAFQAVKHALADAHLAVEMAAPVVHRAAHSLATSNPERSLHASMAKARASDAAMLASRTALQTHGAIGYSHEHDLHLFMKRAWALAAAWGDAAHHRARIGASLFDGLVEGSS